MADNSTEGKVIKDPAPAVEQAANEKLREDSLNQYLAANGYVDPAAKSLEGMVSNPWGRRAYALAEGLSLAPHGLLKATEENWEDKWGLAGKIGMGVAFGVGMRFLLPKGGAAKALVGTVMGAMFVKDAAMPLWNGTQAAAGAENWDELHGASKLMGDGLGHFAFDSGIGIVTGLAGERVTGRVMGATRTGRSIDAWKENFFNSDESRVGRFFNWSSRTADRASDSVSARLIGIKETIRTELPLSEKLRLIQDAQKHQASAYDVDTVLAHKRRYKTPEFQQRIDGALGKNPEAATAAGALDITLPEVPGVTPGGRQTFRKSDGPEVPGGKTSDPFPEPRQPIPGESRRPRTDKPPAQPEAPTTADGVTATEATAAGGRTGSGGTSELNPDHVGNMAVTVRREAAKVTKEDIAVAGIKEDFKGPPIGVTREGPSPLDPNHSKNIGMLVDLINQIENPQHVRQAGMLLDHHRTALQQVELGNAGARGGIPEIQDLNMYSRSVHARMLQMLDEAGIPRSVVRGENSPLFTIRDSDGAGPYTIPAIPKVTDAAVVTLPREYQKMLGVHVSGIYPHELGHDLVYGDLLRFPKALRDEVLTTKVVGKAMEKAGVADGPIDVPGSLTGSMKKSELFVEMLKAQANENTADMFGTSIDPNTGLSLAVLLASLRKPAPNAPKGAPGLLETRSMYGKELADADMGNMLGIEPHGIDRWRVKLSAQTLRELSGGQKGVMEYANHLDKLADNMSRPGENYVWASMDNEGQFISIPMKEWDAIIPSLVKAQLDTPLEALGGKTLRAIAPNMAETFPKVDALAASMADAALKGTTKVPGFDKGTHRIEDVFSAGLSGWLKAVARNPAEGQPGHVPNTVLLERINGISEALRIQYRNDAPEAALLGPRQPVNIGEAAIKPFTAVAHATGRAVAYQPRLRHYLAGQTQTLGAYTGAHYFGDAAGEVLYEMALRARTQGLVEQQQLTNEIVGATKPPPPVAQPGEPPPK